MQLNDNEALCSNNGNYRAEISNGEFRNYDHLRKQVHKDKVYSSHDPLSWAVTKFQKRKHRQKCEYKIPVFQVLPI